MCEGENMALELNKSLVGWDFCFLDAKGRSEDMLMCWWTKWLEY